MGNLNEVVHSDPEMIGGTPVFVGTRVSVRSLFDYLEAGDSLEEFLEAFPTVVREQAIGALQIARAGSAKTRGNGRNDDREYRRAARRKR